MLEAFFTSTLLVAIAEMGDKTQLLSFALTARIKRPGPIIAELVGLQSSDWPTYRKWAENILAYSGRKLTAEGLDVLTVHTDIADPDSVRAMAAAVLRVETFRCQRERRL